MPPSSPEIVAGVLRIPIYELVHGKNARGELGDVTELANALRRLGQQQPVLVEPREDGKWSVWDGNRRLKAARLAGFAHLLAIPRKTPFTGTQRVLRQLGMHATGKAFDPIAEAKAIEFLLFEADEKLSREEVAEALGKSAGWVKGRLDLLQLAEGEQRSVAAGTMPVRKALQKVAVRRGHVSPSGKTWPKTSCGTSCQCRCHPRNRDES